MAERSERSLQGADGLRTLACLLVVFHHLSQQLVFNPTIQAPAALRAIADFFASAGSAGVSVFFVLSGFLLSSPFWSAWFAGGKLPDLRVYAARRAGRIMPGFYLNLLFFFVLGLLFDPPVPGQLWRYFAGLTFTSGFHWLTFFPVDGNGPLWSIGFEVVSYVLMPLFMAGMFLIPGARRRAGVGLVWWLAVWALVLGIHAWLQQVAAVEEMGKGWQYGVTGGAKFWMPRYNPVGFFAHFSLGILASGLGTYWSRRPWHRQKTGLFDALGLVFFVLWCALLVSRTNEDQFSWTILGQPYYFPLFPALSAALLVCLTQSGTLGRVFDNPFSRYTARISFGLYLWHTFVIERFNGGIGDTAEWLMLVAVTLAGSYLIATLSWNHFEEPILKRVQGWKPGTRGPGRFSLAVAGAAAVLVVGPLVLTALVRPAAAELPTTADTFLTFRQGGPVTGLAFAPDGTAYAAKNGSEVYRILPDKRVQRIYTLDGPPAEVRYTNDRPKDQPTASPIPDLFLLKSENPWFWNLRLGPDGNLYVAAGNRVVVLDPDGRELRTVDYPFAPPFGVMDVAFDAQGNLYAGDGQTVFRDERTTGERTVFLDGPQGVLAQAAGLVFNADGTRFYVCDFDHGHRNLSRILEYPVQDGRVVGEPRAVPAEGVIFGARSPSGDLYFSGALGEHIYRWTGAGVQTYSCAHLGPNTALAFGGPGGWLYSANWDGTLGRAALTGTSP